MSGHVFISYAKDDHMVAKRVCDGLEHRGTKCWIAPRDVTPGKNFASEIVRAIQDASSMVLIFSSRANASPHVINEVDRAFHRGLRMFPFRVEEVELSEELQYYLSRPQWIDALGKDLEPSLERLFQHVANPAPHGTDAASQPKVRVEVPNRNGRRWSLWALGGAVVVVIAGLVIVNISKTEYRPYPTGPAVLPYPINK